MDFYTLLIIVHILGTVLGVGSATYIEIFLLKFLDDGVMDPTERRTMHIVYWTLRAGLVLVVLSGVGIVSYSYFALENTWILESAKMWAKNAIVVFIILNAVLLQKRMVPFWLGASISFTSWYAAMILGAWRSVPFSFVEIMIGYAVAVIVMAGVLEGVRALHKKYFPPQSQSQK